MNELSLKEYYGTLSETINALNKEGYTLDFNIKDECLVCNKTNVQLSPDDFVIDKVYRFEGMTDPQDQSVLYAISSARYNVRGLLVNGYGIAADEYASKLVSKLNTHQRAETSWKRTDATAQRPEGNRVISAPLLELDLQATMVQMKSEKSWEEKDHNSIALFKSDTMRIVMMGLHKNAVIKPHSAKGVISLQVISGEIDFITPDKTATLAKDQMITLAAGISHSLLAKEESFLLLTLALEKDKGN